MMMTLPGYHLGEMVYQGTRTVVYRGTHTSDTLPVVIKFLRNEYPTFSELVQFRNQYTIAKNLDLPGIIKPLSLETHGNGYALVMAWEGYISLGEWKQRELALCDFLSIAIQLADILHGLDRNRVIHKDIKPANILIHPKTKQVKLIDFSISSLLPKETQEIQNPNILEGTLAYISPEQTGRMNRGIDYRSDFYSLGVSFYELLTGELPFQSDDPMELVHCHIAKSPTFPERGEEGEIGRKEIPQVLSNLVMKLMAKNAEDRYQSALGLKYDLEKCLRQWKETGNIEGFELGERDICDRFIIPETLYGREAEVQTLLDAFERVAQGHTEMMLVAGFSGIGKTAVVNEVHKPITRHKGYFIKGKFDQFNRNIPFSAFVGAFRSLMGQLLGESDANLAGWKAKILEALGENGQVIIDAIPSLENIIGQQPPVPELSGSAAQNRFNLLFGKFVGVFATQEHPLVLFLDDLQWADSASLNLLKLLMNESETGDLLVLGAYRDNEVFGAHPLMLTLDEMQKRGATINTLTLGVLDGVDITRLVADTLLCSTDIAAPLSELVYQKTQGNPFFTTQFLQGLHEDGCISFEVDAGYWQCDLAQVRQLALTEDVVEFMVERLQKLPQETQEVLKLAACIGNQFDLGTLAVVCEESLEEVATDLWRSLQEGFVVPESETYKFFQGDELEEKGVEDVAVGYRFLHDRVQQAAYSLIRDDRKQITHLNIGRSLLQKTSKAQWEENLFKIVNQLNMGLAPIEKPSELEELAQLNLAAARKAKFSAAYNAAASYLKTAIELLCTDATPSQGWQTHYALMLSLHTLLAEVSYLNGDFEAAQQQIQIVFDRTRDILDRVKAYEIRISLLVAQGQCQAALDVGLDILSLLDVALDDAPRSDIDIDRLYTLPTIADRQIVSALSILSKLWAPAFIANPQLLPSIILTMLNLSATYGNSATGAFAYALYGMLLCATMTDLELGYRFGQLALHTLDRYEDAELTCKVNQLFHAFIRNWKEPARDRVECLADNVLTGLENGDIEFACYSAINYCDNLCVIGESLTLIYQKQTYYIELIESLQQEFQYFAAAIWGQFVENLIGMAVDPKQLVGQRFDEDEAIPKLKQMNAFTALFFFYTAKTILYYLFDDYEGTLVHSESASQYEEAGGGLLPVTQIPLYRALALLALYPTASPERQAQMLDEVKTHQQRLKIWADRAPENFQHKLDLVAAETARIQGHRAQAIELYDLAISGAKENEYIHEEALANELAAKFYLDWGKEKVASGYLQEAYYGYARWGAKAKVAHLEQNYPQLLAAILQPTHPQLPSESTIPLTQTRSATSTSPNLWLDFPAVLKAAQGISEEIELEKLLATLMQIAISNAGAQSGHLVLYQDRQWVAIATSDRERFQLLETPLARYSNLPQSLIYSVARTQETVVFENLSTADRFAGDRYLITHQPKSVLCMPMSRQGKLIGILYLENNLTIGAFTRDRIEILKLLSSQAAISLENARLYQQTENYSYTLEAEVERKTEALNNKARALEGTLEQLQRTQAQLIQTEKMSSLGQLVAGIAHEINNPVNFIHGNIHHINNYIEDLIGLLEIYQKGYPNKSAVIQEKNEEIDLYFMLDDIQKILGSMEVGSERIRKIVLNLRNFSRLDESIVKTIDLKSGIESTLLILKHRLQETEDRPEVRVVKEFNGLPKITCCPSQLNQVFLNIINNAIDAIRETPQGGENPEIRIRTEVLDPQHIRIAIANTGSPIPKGIQDRIFDPFFTTKPVGRGTGLGLFVSYSIIEKHGGTITVRSNPGEGTEFEIVVPIECKPIAGTQPSYPA